jgi:hypothetical protein
LGELGKIIISIVTGYIEQKNINKQYYIIFNDMKINEIPKFVLNLEKRKDRLEYIEKEMSYIGWDYELFNAVDTGSYLGCTLSHIAIIDIAIERGYDHVMVIEDDCTFMPYSKSFIKKLDLELEDVEYGILNLSPTHNRPVKISENYKLLIDITNFPPKEERHRGVFATNMIIYHKSIYDEVKKITTNNLQGHYAIDEYIYLNVTSKKQSYCPILPISVQKSDFSDVTQGSYNNFYMQTYNWNLYSPNKIDNEYLDYDNVQKIKENNTHKIFEYVS